MSGTFTTDAESKVPTAILCILLVRGYFQYVLTVVCKYHLHFLGPYSIITQRSRPSSMFIVGLPGRTELILLS